MKIEIEFEFHDGQWDEYIQKNAARASEILASSSFLAKVKQWPNFDSTDKRPDEVARVIETANVVRVRVGYFPVRSSFLLRKFDLLKNRTTAAIADEGADGLVRFNRSKKPYGAGSPGNIAHETMHVLGFRHTGNKRAGNENSVPYRIGEWVDEQCFPGALSPGEEK